MHSHQVCFPNDTNIMVKQKKLTIIVRAFLSVKYFRMNDEEVNDRNFFIALQR